MHYALLVLVPRDGVQRVDLDLGTRSMADDDGSRRPSRLSTPVNPAGVGSSASNRGSTGMVSPDTIREILQTGDQSLIDDACEQWSAADIGQYLATIPTPSPVRAFPAGVGSAASNRSSTASPGVPRTFTGAVAGAGGGGGGGGGGGSSPGSSSGSRSGGSSRSRGRGSTPQGSGRGSTPQGSGRGGTPPASGRASTPRGRPQQAQKQPRGRGRGQAQKRPRRPNPSPTLPWSRPGSSTQGSPRAPLNQADLQRRLRMLLQDQEQIAAGRRIANITTTNSIVTSYKGGGRPSVQSNSSRYSF